MITKRERTRKNTDNQESKATMTHQPSWPSRHLLWRLEDSECTAPSAEATRPMPRTPPLHCQGPSLQGPSRTQQGRGASPKEEPGTQVSPSLPRPQTPTDLLWRTGDVVKEGEGRSAWGRLQMVQEGMSPPGPLASDQVRSEAVPTHSFPSTASATRSRPWSEQITWKIPEESAPKF